MKYSYFFLLLVSVVTLLTLGKAEKSLTDNFGEDIPQMVTLKLFIEIFPDSTCSYPAFNNAFIKMRELQANNKLKNDTILTIIDFSKESNQERLFIIDLKNKKIPKNILVAHGINSGVRVASEFSNIPKSHKSSLGAYITGETYRGKHGYSLLLNGMERGLNHNARKRAIVMHGANYVSKKYIKKTGRLGRSFGCPAISYAQHRMVINLIKNASCLYIYHPSVAKPTLALH